MDKKHLVLPFKSSIFKNLSILVSGTIIAQIIVIGFQVILRRVYTPQEFGAFAVYMSMLGILATISSFRYEQTILLPKSREHAWKLSKLSILVALGFSLVLFFVIFLFPNPILTLADFPLEFISWLYLLPGCIFIFSVAQILNFFLIKESQYKVSASNKIYRRSSEGILQGLMGFFNQSFGLIVGDFIGQIFITIRSWLKVEKQGLSDDCSFKALAARYSSFPLKNGIPALMNAVSLLLPIIILNRKFTEEQTGYFDLARMILILPLSLVTASLSQVLLQQFSEKRNFVKSIKNDVLSTLIPLAFLAIIFGLIIQFFGPLIFKFIFGEVWYQSGIYASILVWAFMLKFVISPFNIVFTAFEKIGILSIWQTFYFILILILNWLPFKSIESFLYAYLIIELISYSFAGVLNLSVILKYEKGLNHNNTN